MWRRVILGLFLWGVFLVALAVVLVMAGESSAETFYVDGAADDGGDGSLEEPLTTIQDAIDSSAHGDTIQVHKGIYNENLMVDKSVSLVGDGPEETIIDGQEQGDVVVIHAEWVNVSGFGVRGSGDAFSGLRLQADHSTLSGNNITWCGIGIYLNGTSHGSLTDTNFSNSGYAVYLRSATNNAITGTTTMSSV